MFRIIITHFQRFIEGVLGIYEENKVFKELKEVMRVLIEVRLKTKIEKNYGYSDFIRKKLELTGIHLQVSKSAKTDYTLNKTSK